MSLIGNPSEQKIQQKSNLAKNFILWTFYFIFRLSPF